MFKKKITFFLTKVMKIVIMVNVGDTEQSDPVDHGPCLRKRDKAQSPLL